MSTYFKHQGKCAANLRSNTIDLEATLRPTYTPEQTVPLLPHPSTSPRRGRRPAIWSASTRCTKCPPGGEWRPCAAAAFRRGILIAIYGCLPPFPQTSHPPPSLRPREGSNDAALKRQSESVPSQVFLDPYHVRCMQDTAYVRPRPTITTHTQVGDGNLFSDRLSSGAPNVRMEQYQLGGQTCKDIAPPRPSRATHRNCTVPFLPSGCARSYARLGQGEAARSGP